MVNSIELERVMTFIDDHPETHLQSSWICGSGACFAGWAARLNGWRELDWGTAIKGELIREVKEIAQDILGISDYDALILFLGSNTRDVLRDMIKDLCNGEALRQHWELSGDGVPTMVRVR